MRGRERERERAEQTEEFNLIVQDIHSTLFFSLFQKVKTFSCVHLIKAATLETKMLLKGSFLSKEFFVVTVGRTIIRSLLKRASFILSLSLSLSLCFFLSLSLNFYLSLHSSPLLSPCLPLVPFSPFLTCFLYVSFLNFLPLCFSPLA